MSSGGTRPIENVSTRRDRWSVRSGVHVAEPAADRLAEAMATDVPRAAICLRPATMQSQLELPFVDLGTGAASPGTMGSDPRPIAVPNDVDDSRHEEASGFVQLPSNVRRSGPPKTYDLDDPIDRTRVYEGVLREGTDDDVRRFIDVDVLEKLWDTLVVPARVRGAWADWFRRRHGVDLAD